MWVYSCNIVTVASPPSLISGFPFPSPWMSLSSSCLGVPFFPCSHGDGYLFCSHTDLWAAAAAAEVTLVYLPTNLFAFHLTLCTENETLLFWDTRGGKILHPEVMQFKNVPHFLSWAFQEWPTLLEGHVWSPWRVCWTGTANTRLGEGVEVFCHGWTWPSGGD